MAHLNNPSPKKKSVASKPISSVMFFPNGTTIVFDTDGQQMADLQQPWFNFDAVRKLATQAGKDGAKVEGVEVLPNSDFNYFYRDGSKGVTT